MGALEQYGHWIFDLDGTLTHAAHDFEAIRTRLGLPSGQAILEAIAELPLPLQAERNAELNAIEEEIAGRSRIAKGAMDLLENLKNRGVHMGIVTRNTRNNALISLAATGMLPFFEEQDILGREEHPPKPAPDALLALLQDWDATTEEALMVGDFVYDMVAAKRAKISAIGVDVFGRGELHESADRVVRSLEELFQ